MKHYTKDIAVQLSGSQIADLLSAVNKCMTILKEEDKAVQAMLSILARKFMLKVLQKSFEPRPQKVKLLTEHAAVLHYIHCNYSLMGILTASEANTMLVCINVIDQKLS